MNILVVGSGAREHIIAKYLLNSRIEVRLFCYSEFLNPAVDKLSTGYLVGKFSDLSHILKFAISNKVELAIIGPEKPLELGLADILYANGIKVIGPGQKSAKLETDKAFARELLTKYISTANPIYKIFNNLNGVEDWLSKLNDNYVIKANGLAGGKGVKVSGKHISSRAEALSIVSKFLENHNCVVIEEKLIGEEFSLHSFVDGNNLYHMPLVQDHKLALDNDQGPNTGGMGSYSDANHSLPFLKKDDVNQARFINEKVIEALKKETRQEYKGILYGSYILTKNGIKVIEFNTRFGDPEVINLLSLLDTDFLDICLAIFYGNLDKINISFKQLATVCKYIVPKGYPDNSLIGAKIDISNLENIENLYFASVSETSGILKTMNSRSFAFVAVGSKIQDAFVLAHNEVAKIKGDIYYRQDIGSEILLRKKINFVKEMLIH